MNKEQYDWTVEYTPTIKTIYRTSIKYCEMKSEETIYKVNEKDFNILINLKNPCKEGTKLAVRKDNELELQLVEKMIYHFKCYRWERSSIIFDLRLCAVEIITKDGTIRKYDGYDENSKIMLSIFGESYGIKSVYDEV